MRSHCRLIRTNIQCQHKQHQHQWQQKQQGQQDAAVYSAAERKQLACSPTRRNQACLPRPPPPGQHTQPLLHVQLLQPTASHAHTAHQHSPCSAVRNVRHSMRRHQQGYMCVPACACALSCARQGGSWGGARAIMPVADPRGDGQGCPRRVGGRLAQATSLGSGRGARSAKQSSPSTHRAATWHACVDGIPVRTTCKHVRVPRAGACHVCSAVCSLACPAAARSMLLGVPAASFGVCRKHAYIRWLRSRGQFSPGECHACPLGRSR